MDEVVEFAGRRLELSNCDFILLALRLAWTVSGIAGSEQDVVQSTADCWFLFDGVVIFVAVAVNLQIEFVKFRFDCCRFGEQFWCCWRWSDSGH